MDSVTTQPEDFAFRRAWMLKPSAVSQRWPFRSAIDGWLALAIDDLQRGVTPASERPLPVQEEPALGPLVIMPFPIGHPRNPKVQGPQGQISLRTDPAVTIGAPHPSYDLHAPSVCTD